MKGSRRDFLKAAGITAIGGAGLGMAGFRLARAEDHVAEALASGTRWAMVVNLPQWVELDEGARRRAFDACHRTHNVPDFVNNRNEEVNNDRHEIKWIWEEEFHSAFPMQYHNRLIASLHDARIPVLCNHCERPSCVRVCPTKATWKREDGVVMMDMHRCIGCRYCIIACPYGSRSFNFRDPRDGIDTINHDFPTRMRGVVEKCNFCAERLANNQIPLCVETLGEDGPLVFGDLSQENSPIRQALHDRYTIRRKPELGTDPHVFYVVA